MGFFISNQYFKTMKEQIIDYFKKDKSYATGAKLVIRYSLKLGLKKQVNLQPESPYLLGVIQEELRQLAGITEQTMRSFLQLPAVKEQVKMSITSAEPKDETTDVPKGTATGAPKSGKAHKPAITKNNKPLGKPRGRRK